VTTFFEVQFSEGWVASVIKSSKAIRMVKKRRWEGHAYGRKGLKRKVKVELSENALGQT
jgi:hypothetical protein